MKKCPVRRIVLTFWLCLCGAIVAPLYGYTQDAAPAPILPAEPGLRERHKDDLMLQLNLTPEQIEALRTIRQEQLEQKRAANQRRRLAQRALDEAIYVQNADEATVESLARELAASQAEVIRLQALAELRFRRVLNPEQLGRFLNLRRQARALQERYRRPRSTGDPQRRPPQDISGEEEFQQKSRGVRRRPPGVRPDGGPGPESGPAQGTTSQPLERRP
jgi:Spy/CpxP family protein refolding chaperone